MLSHMYNAGQLFAIKNIVKQKLLRGVRVTAVDNFQGEENDIIILSLVRSNEEVSEKYNWLQEFVRLVTQ